MKESVCLFSLAVALGAGAAELRPIGELATRLAKDVPGSSWTIGCETLDRELDVFANYKDRLPGLGIKRIRLQGGWARCEKRKTGDIL